MTRVSTLLLICALLVCAACTRPKPTVTDDVPATAAQEVAPPTTESRPAETVVSVWTSTPAATIPAGTPTFEVPVAPLAPFHTATHTPAPVTPTPQSAEATAPSPEVADPVPAEIAGTHVVQQGETLFMIGERYGIPWLDIARANEIGSPYWIVAGQRLTIPQEGAVQPVAPTVPTVPVTERTHVVQQGENLFRIGLKYGMSWEAIAQANGITDPTQVYVGQKLVIP